MRDARETLWVAEFSGPHIEGTACLALPEKVEGFEVPYRRAELVVDRHAADKPVRALEAARKRMKMVGWDAFPETDPYRQLYDMAVDALAAYEKEIAE